VASGGRKSPAFLRIYGGRELTLPARLGFGLVAFAGRGIVSRMDAAPSVRESLPSRVDALRITVLGSTGALAAIGLLLVARRAAGAIDAELGVAPLAATLLLAAWPSAQSFAWLMWLPLVGVDWYSRTHFLYQSKGASVEGLVRSGVPPLAPLHQGESETLQGCEAEESVVQQLVRARDAHGVESIHGTLLAGFAAGQRHATLYVGFCPPLERLPDIEAEVADGPDAAIKVVQAFAHGARLDLRLGEAAEEACCVIVEFVAVPAATTLL
jgi:hypothetical protein